MTINHKYSDRFKEFMNVMTEHGKDRPLVQLFTTAKTKHAKKTIDSMAKKRVMSRVSVVNAVTKGKLPTVLQFINVINNAVMSSPLGQTLTSSPLSFFLANCDMFRHLKTAGSASAETRANYRDCFNKYPDTLPWNLPMCRGVNLARVFSGTKTVWDFVNFLDIPGEPEAQAVLSNDMSDENVREATYRSIVYGAYGTPAFKALYAQYGDTAPMDALLKSHWDAATRAANEDQDYSDMMPYNAAIGRLAKARDANWFLTQAATSSHTFRKERHEYNALRAVVLVKAKSLFQRYLSSTSQIPLKPDIRLLFLLTLYLYRKKPWDKATRDRFLKDQRFSREALFDYLHGRLFKSDDLDVYYALAAFWTNYNNDKQMLEKHHKIAASAYRKIRNKHWQSTALERLSSMFIDIVRLRQLKDDVYSSERNALRSSIRVRSKDVS